MTSTGGIDLTSDKALSVQNAGQSIKFRIDSSMLKQLQNAPGFTPVIINIRPMGNIRLFLGLKDSTRHANRHALTQFGSTTIWPGKFYFRKPLDYVII